MLARLPSQLVASPIPLGFQDTDASHCPSLNSISNTSRPPSHAFRACLPPSTQRSYRGTAPDAVALALQGSDAPPPALSEQAVLALTLIDALPYLPIALLEEWLPLCAELLNEISDDSMRENVKARYWEVLVSGEMDAERSGVAVCWWTTKGGRERVLYGREEELNFMSGALPVEERHIRESKL
ncbi:hypothetical protein P3342_009029 [Pyrenophora teres f. teres]|nr:hypothetical protein P3342_009029 [Pyrenophora teres f. teres]